LNISIVPVRNIYKLSVVLINRLLNSIIPGHSFYEGSIKSPTLENTVHLPLDIVFSTLCEKYIPAIPIPIIPNDVIITIIKGHTISPFVKGFFLKSLLHFLHGGQQLK